MDQPPIDFEEVLSRRFANWSMDQKVQILALRRSSNCYVLGKDTLFPHFILTQ